MKNARSHFQAVLRPLWLLVLLAVSGPSAVHATSVRDSLLTEFEAADGPEDKGNLLFSLSRFYRRTNLDSATYFIEEALKVAKAAKLDDRYHRYLMSRASIHWMQSQTDQSQAHYETALAHWRKTGNLEEVTRCLLNLGNVRYSAGEPLRAIDYLKESQQLAEENGFALMAAQSVGTIANVYYSLEKLDSSLHYRLATSEAFAALGDTFNLVRSETNLGWHFRETGQSHRARIHYQKALELLPAVEFIGLKGQVYEGIGELEFRSGNLQAACDNFMTSRKYFRELGWHKNIAYNDITVGMCFKMLGRNAAAEAQFKSAFQLADSVGNKAAAAMAINRLGELYRHMGRNKEAIRRFRQAIAIAGTDSIHFDRFSLYLGLGLSMMQLEMRDSADYFLEQAFALGHKHKYTVEMGGAMKDLAAFAFSREDYRGCVARIDSALHWYAADKHSRGLHEAFSLKSKCLERMGDFVGALEAQRAAAQWRDSIQSADVAESLLAIEAQLWSEKKQHALDIARSEQELKTKEAELAANESNRLITQRNWLITIFVLLLVVGVLFFYINRKLRQNAMQRKISELRIAALRSQMNPHFIFNALGSVQLLINTQKSREANTYLSKFARMLRMILENSDSPTLSLEEEVEALRLYVELEALRFKFEYEITVDADLSTADIQIPGMLIQPFVENAIKHGIAGKQEAGRLKLEFLYREEGLLCVVEDNGIGREEAGRIRRSKGQHHSRGTEIIRGQLELVRPHRKDRLRIIDLEDEQGNAAGTRVEIRLELTA